MKNSVISVPGIFGFFFGLIGLPLLKILAILLFCKIVLAGGLIYYMAAIMVLCVVFLIISFSDLGKKKVPQKSSEASQKFLNGFVLGIITLFMFLVLVITDSLDATGLNFLDLF